MPSIKSMVRKLREKSLAFGKNHIDILFFSAVTLLLVGIIARNILDYFALEEQSRHAAYHEAKVLYEQKEAIKDRVEQLYLGGTVELNEHTIRLLPYHISTTLQINDRQKPCIMAQEIAVKVTSDNLRNQANAPNSYEKIAIDYFKRNKQERELVQFVDINGSESLIYCAPLKIQSYCLKCHGEKANAPKYVRDKYTGGYGYKLGDIRGVISVTVNEEHIKKDLMHDFQNNLIFSMVLAYCISYLLFMVMSKVKENELGYIAQLEHLSYTDSLTGLYNRRRFDLNIDIYRNLFERYKEVFSLIIVDIDNFKDVNDTFGHQVGDHVLKELATILIENGRKSDNVTRWGGEEFIIVCPNTTKEEASIHAEHLRKKISEHEFGIAGHKTASFGVVQMKENESVDDLIKRVDEALYTAKSSGKNIVVCA